MNAKELQKMDKKKELKNKYKEMKKLMGVYQIKNTKNNKVLIDSSVDIMSVWNRHKSELKFGTHRNKALQADWKELGESNFVFEVLSELEIKDKENVDYKKELKILQEMVINELNIKDELFYK